MMILTVEECFVGVLIFKSEDAKGINDKKGFLTVHLFEVA